MVTAILPPPIMLTVRLVCDMADVPNAQTKRIANETMYCSVGFIIFGVFIVLFPKLLGERQTRHHVLLRLSLSSCRRWIGL